MLRTTRRDSGQALVVMVLAMLAVIAGLGLIIDGGNAWAQQRMTQAGNDASAEAGAMILAQNLAGGPTPAGGWDAAVLAAVTTSAANNDVDVDVAYYTDICGTLLRTDGTKASGTGQAAVVGGGVLPTSNNTNPDCPTGTVGPVAGVQVMASRAFDTFISAAVGLREFTARTQATAVSGLLQGTCAAEGGCIVLPVTVPVTVVTCATNGEVENTATPWPSNTRIVVPLCKNNPGNVGWLDWTPKGGGAKELEESILTPNNPPIDLPSWNYVTQTGNPNSKMIEDALNTYMGQIVLFPLFDLTCSEDPDLGQTKVAPDYGCGDVGGNGSNQWYRFPAFAAFELEEAFVNGSNKAACDTGNGATSCLIGKFVDFITVGTVGPGIGGGTTEGAVIGTQLIR
ncbi:MAG TPA: Tad domain-containing protein [Candidatus Limnocylindrales bacterium]|nr:Tad domain-containing protein [Candidatus Limnocylindrales bacterium]